MASPEQMLPAGHEPVIARHDDDTWSINWPKGRPAGDEGTVFVACTPELLEQFVEGHNRLVDRLAYARDRVEQLEGWSNELAVHVPERYEANEGAQEHCISLWLADVLADLDRFREALRIVAENDTGVDLDRAGEDMQVVARQALAAEASGEMTAEARAEAAADEAGAG